MAGDVATRRPQASKPRLESTGDPLVDLGLLMAGTQRIEDGQAELGGRMDAIEAAWRGVKAEHETTQSQVLHMQKDVDELLREQRLTQKMIRRLGKLGPAALALVEVIRYVADHVQQIPHH